MPPIASPRAAREADSHSDAVAAVRRVLEEILT